jgi:hypothetical protein
MRRFKDTDMWEGLERNMDKRREAGKGTKWIKERKKDIWEKGWNELQKG